MNRLSVKLPIAIIMDFLGLMLMFVACDLQFRLVWGFFTSWNPFNYVISTGYPLRAIFGGFFFFGLVCLGHLGGAIWSTFKYKDRFDKYILRVFRTYK